MNNRNSIEKIPAGLKYPLSEKMSKLIPLSNKKKPRRNHPHYSKAGYKKKRQRSTDIFETSSYHPKKHGRNLHHYISQSNGAKIDQILASMNIDSDNYRNVEEKLQLFSSGDNLSLELINEGNTPAYLMLKDSTKIDSMAAHHRPNLFRRELNSMKHRLKDLASSKSSSAKQLDRRVGGGSGIRYSSSQEKDHDGRDSSIHINTEDEIIDEGPGGRGVLSLNSSGYKFKRIHLHNLEDDKVKHFYEKLHQKNKYANSSSKGKGLAKEGTLLEKKTPRQKQKNREKPLVDLKLTQKILKKQQKNELTKNLHQTLEHKLAMERGLISTQKFHKNTKFEDGNKEYSQTLKLSKKGKSGLQVDHDYRYRRHQDPKEAYQLEKLRKNKSSGVFGPRDNGHYFNRHRSIDNKDQLRETRSPVINQLYKNTGGYMVPENVVRAKIKLSDLNRLMKKPPHMKAGVWSKKDYEADQNKSLIKLLKSSIEKERRQRKASFERRKFLDYIELNNLQKNQFPNFLSKKSARMFMGQASNPVMENLTKIRVKEADQGLLVVSQAKKARRPQMDPPNISTPDENKLKRLLQKNQKKDVIEIRFKKAMKGISKMRNEGQKLAKSFDKKPFKHHLEPLEKRKASRSPSQEKIDTYKKLEKKLQRIVKIVSEKQAAMKGGLRGVDSPTGKVKQLGGAASKGRLKLRKIKKKNLKKDKEDPSSVISGPIEVNGSNIQASKIKEGLENKFKLPIVGKKSNIPRIRRKRKTRRNSSADGPRIPPRKPEVPKIASIILKQKRSQRAGSETMKAAMKPKPKTSKAKSKEDQTDKNERFYSEFHQIFCAFNMVQMEADESMKERLKYFVGTGNNQNLVDSHLHDRELVSFSPFLKNSQLIWSQSSKQKSKVCSYKDFLVAGLKQKGEDEAENGLGDGENEENGGYRDGSVDIGSPRKPAAGGENEVNKALEKSVKKKLARIAKKKAKKSKEITNEQLDGYKKLLEEQKVVKINQKFIQQVFEKFSQIPGNQAPPKITATQTASEEAKDQDKEHEAHPQKPTLQIPLYTARPSKLFLFNHIKGMKHIGRKQLLTSNVYHHCKSLGTITPERVIPETFLINQESSSQDIASCLDKIQASLDSGDFKGPWIIKPGEFSNRGKGIKMAYKVDEIEGLVIDMLENRKGSVAMVQRYLVDPLLFEKRKFDLRCYALVIKTPGKFSVYWYNQGYARTSSYNYDTMNKDNLMVHLTNEAVQVKCKIIEMS